jgi:ABC-type multidrug transport system permease subunit
LNESIERLDSELKGKRADLERAWNDARTAREKAVEQTRASLRDARREAETRLQRELARTVQETQKSLDAQASELRGELRRYVAELDRRRAEFAAWLAELKRRAGSHAGDIPTPPSLPELPDSLRALLASDAAPLRVAVPALPADLLPAAPSLALPPLPDPPRLDVPELHVPEPPSPPGALAIEEVNVSGGSDHINTFDQNVPGFSVTFLLLGMLLGVSMALLDERDWGTLDRMRTMPIAAGNVLLAKLASRCLVGMAQMIALFAFGFLAFGVSLGPQPWVLLLPTAGIVLAGTAFGLVVASVVPSREAVLPVGSIVIVTMAAVGGCWWPIDLEPRWMRTVALAFPTTWAMDAFNDLMIRRRGIEAALKPTGILLAHAAVYVLVGLLLSRRRAAARRG